MAENSKSGLNADHPDPGPKPTSVGSAKFTPIGSYVDLQKDASMTTNQKSDIGTSGKL